MHNKCFCVRKTKYEKLFHSGTRSCCRRRRSTTGRCPRWRATHSAGGRPCLSTGTYRHYFSNTTYSQYQIQGFKFHPPLLGAPTIQNPTPRSSWTRRWTSTAGSSCRDCRGGRRWWTLWSPPTSTAFTRSVVRMCFRKILSDQTLLLNIC